eukprot:Nitzschia sp. Nitz4//scaffold28_size193895//177849//178793//NITZ4_001690-RA/size193895-processed-gene-0.285-mRNA-1//-1//CDS//3329546057//5202//frame0
MMRNISLLSRPSSLPSNVGVRRLSTAAPNRLVISRRAWQSHKKTLPPKPKVKKESAEDKPWPRNMQIAGYAALAIFVPYTGIWVTTSSPTLREYLAPYIPLDKFRTHFGEPEWDAKSATEADEELENEYYQYPLEAPWKDRMQQQTIEELDQQNVQANVYVLGDSQRQEVKVIPGSTKANSETLASMVGAEKSQKMAVDFDTGDDMPEESTFSQEEDLLGSLSANAEEPSQELLRRTHTFSSWYYFPAQDRENAKSEKVSDDEIERLRLEYTIQKLGEDLQDPLCTRDRDEMQDELKQAKRDLSRLRWKKRLGM